VEYLDDADRPYLCVDATGARVRLIVWDLELLVAQVVPSDYSYDQVLIAESDRRADSLPSHLSECYGKLVLRRLTVRSRTGEIAEPGEWSRPVVGVKPDSAEPASSVSTHQFHGRWMVARRGGRKYP